jgi:oligopeptidase A
MTDSKASADNPLLNAAGLPEFSRIRPEHVEPAVREMLARQHVVLEELQSVETPDLAWLEKLEALHEAVHKVWNPVVHLNSVVSSAELRAAHNACLPMITDFYTDLGQNRAIYERFLMLQRSPPNEDAAVRQIINLAVRDFKLAGVALEGEQRKRFKEIMQALAALQATFEQNVMDATDAFSHHETNREKLVGLPEVALGRAARAAQEKGLGGWVFALDPPTYQIIMSHAEHRRLRELFYVAWNTRASDQGPNAGQWDNGPLIQDILALRSEAALLLGFDSFADESLATKMARSKSEVIDFLHDLAGRSKPPAEQQFDELTSLAGHELEPWDVAYYSERLKRQKLDLSEEELRPYFPLDRVLSGLFDLAERLFEIRITQSDDVDVWHDSVRYYDLRHGDGSTFGGLYADYYARPNKRGGAWMDACVNRSAIGPTPQLPVAHLVCNFGSPVGDTPSLLTHGEVVTLFHEFGHTLHHLLTTVDYPSIAGINGVAWDAVELPSQFLENYAFEPAVLAEISGHYETGTPLPPEKVAKLNQSRTFLAGLAMVRQLEFALFDMLLHSRRESPSFDEVCKILDDVRREVAVVRHPAYTRFPNAFSHIFGGGYAAGYYSYKWAEVLAADAFAAFEESGVFDGSTARRYRDCILAVGGSREALDAFKSFRGREPKLEPLLRHAGIDTTSPET